MEVNFDDIKDSMSAMARSFYTQSRKVLNHRIKRELGYELKYPTYREGLKAQYLEEMGAAGGGEEKQGQGEHATGFCTVF